jgi:hypothetical protein
LLLLGDTLEDLQTAAIDADHGHAGRLDPFGNPFALRQGFGLIGRNRGVAFRHAFVANGLAQAANFLFAHVQFGQVAQVFFGQPVRAVLGPRESDFGLQSGAEVGAINGETFALREKKPADSGCRRLSARSRPSLRPGW